MPAAGLPALDDLAALVEERAGKEMAAARLAIAIDVGRDLTELGDALIGRFVADARAGGLSWTEIGLAFGTSKQAAQQRYGSAIRQWPGRWTPDASQILARAGDEARDLGHGYIGTEHLLLALVTARSGVAPKLLRELGVTRQRMLGTSCMRAGADDRAAQECLSVMPRLKQALEHSRRVADRLDTPVADTEHLLAGIVAVPDSMAVEILRRLGVSVSDVQVGLAAALGIEPDRLGAPRRRRRLRVVSH